MNGITLHKGDLPRNLDFGPVVAIDTEAMGLNPLRDHLAQAPIEQKKGIVTVPTGPGLGIEIDREVLKKYKVA